MVAVSQNLWRVGDIPCGGMMVLLSEVMLYITSNSISNKQEKEFSLVYVTLRNE
jgi:hypothetical protein